MSIFNGEVGINFTTIWGPKPSDDLIQTWVDRANEGTYYYRLRISNYATVSFSNVLMLRINSNHLKVYPTIISRGELLKVEGLDDGQYEVIFYNIAGISKKLMVSMNKGQVVIENVSNSLKPGVYWIAFINNKNRMHSIAQILVLK